MEDKIAVIEDALTQMQYKDYVTPSVHTGLGTCFDIGTAELFLLRAYYKGEITYIAISRLKIMEDTINFEEVDNNTIRVWVGIQIDDYLYGLLSNTNINTEEKTEPQSPFVPNNN